MLYLWPGSNSLINYPDWYGVMASWRRWTVQEGIIEGRPWALDNDAFTVGFNPSRFFAALADRYTSYRETCLFIVVPDKVGNALATLDKYRAWAWRIKELGFPVAFVAQDGQELFDFPPEFDWLFIGGTTDWKLSPMADDCIRRAKALGKPVHVGRVNSQRRIRHFKMMEVDSVDGTTICYAPDKSRKNLDCGLANRPLFTLL